MKSLLSTVAVTALALMASMAGAQDTEDPQQPTQSAAAGLDIRTPTKLGCFSSPGKMWDMGGYTYQTSGWCQPLCVRQGASYFALVNGTNCFCGSDPPDSSDKVDNNFCNAPCNGYKPDTCGGTNKWFVYADNYRNGDNTGSIKITTPTQTWFGHQVTKAPDSKGSADGLATKSNQPQTIIVTQAGSPVKTVIQATQSASTGSSGPNKAGIAAGVIVGVVAFAGIVGGVIFFIRRKKQKELDDERRRHDAITNFVTRGEKPPSTFSASDSRLEPSVMFQRRQSDGSIADNQDYSRRILKVTNPDDR